MITFITVLILNKRNNQRDDRIGLTSITIAVDILIIVLVSWLVFHSIGWI